MVLEDVAYVEAPETAETERTRVKVGDVLLSITADLGRTAVVPEGLGAAHINQHLSILRTSKMVPKFLSAYLASPAGQRELIGRNRQAVKAGLNFDDIRSFRVLVPPPEMQRTFVERAQCTAGMMGLVRRSLEDLADTFDALQHRAFAGEL